jgi:predicted flap endonuclease-1-like 5' DNA nuclease
MTTQLLWFVLAGFLLGFTASTLWEWFYFRKERVKVRDRRVLELEAQLRVLEQQHPQIAPTGSVAPPPGLPAVYPTPPAAAEEWAAPAYRSPGVFLETEEVQPRPSDNGPGPYKPPAQPVPDERPAPATALPPRPPEPAPASASRSTAPPRRWDTVTPLAVRREALRAQPRPSAQEYTPPARAAPPVPAGEPAPAPDWAADPALTRRSTDSPDDLCKVKGIGEVYRQRLYAAGIFTWHQVATADIDLLRRATGAYPSSNVEEWPEQARKLAEKHGRANAVYTGPQPDDLTKIIGIGPVGAQVLYRHGICTYEQLAVALFDELSALFPIAVAGDQPDFKRWIAQALELANAKHKR